MQSETYYELLGVNTEATLIEIKKGYKKQALKWHPDRVEGEQNKLVATERFQKISEAYETLSDAKRRRTYDDSLQGDAGFTSNRNSAEQAENRFTEEFADLFQEAMTEIHGQAAEGDRVAPTVAWTLLGGIAGAVLGTIFFPPAIIPMIFIGGSGGAVKGYTDSDVVAVVKTMNPETKARILNLMMSENSDEN